jgi:formylglycine-generating enzyme required for sulfatase activity
MGSLAGDPRQGLEGIGRPQHRVTISHTFAVGKFEVTRNEYAGFARETRIPDPDGCNVHDPPNWPKETGLNCIRSHFPRRVATRWCASAGRKPRRIHNG